MKSILLATANTDRMIVLMELLQKHGYTVLPACDADMALSFFHDNVRADAVIIDNGMKGFWGVIGTARLQDSTPPSVLVMSERVSVTDYVEALSMGAFDFIFLPIPSSELLRIVHAAVSEHARQSDSVRNGLRTVAPGNSLTGL